MRFAPAWSVGAGIENEAVTAAGDACPAPVAVTERTVRDADCAEAFVLAPPEAVTAGTENVAV